jgi:hypothetical protein
VPPRTLCMERRHRSSPSGADASSIWTSFVCRATISGNDFRERRKAEVRGIGFKAKLIEECAFGAVGNLLTMRAVYCCPTALADKRWMSGMEVVAEG